jgi:hypothetical protein
MSFIPEDYAQVNYRFSTPNLNQVAEITHGIQFDVTTPDLDQTADDLMDAWDTAWGSTLSNQWALVGVDVRANLGGSDLEVGTSSLTAQTGGDVAQPPPPNVAVLIQKRSSFAGRANRGRFYFPPIIGEGQVNGAGTIDPTVLGARNVIAANWLAAVVAVTGVQAMVILHTEAGPLPRVVQSLVVDSRVATQRRRLR